MESTENNNLALSDDQIRKKPQTRLVEVVTVPVKNIGPARKAAITFISWMSGSPLTWAMHWAIRVDGTYFELQRPGGSSKPRLLASVWTEKRCGNIITALPVGSTSLSDDEIIAASEPYFTDKTSALWYSVYVNNCQLYVHFSLEKIAPAVKYSGNQLPPVLQITIGSVINNVICILTFPLLLVYIRWLKWRGCDQKSLQAYAALFTMSVTMIWPGITITLGQTYSMLHDIFESQPLLMATIASLPPSIMAPGFMLFLPSLAFPRAKRRQNGNWKVSSRMNQNNEETVEPEVKIEVSYPLLSALVGGCMGFALWMLVATPYLVRASLRFFGTNLSFRSPWEFFKSLWVILMIPLFESTPKTHEDILENLDSNG